MMCTAVVVKGLFRPTPDSEGTRCERKRICECCIFARGTLSTNLFLAALTIFAAGIVGVFMKS